MAAERKALLIRRLSGQWYDTFEDTAVEEAFLEMQIALLEMGDPAAQTRKEKKMREAKNEGEKSEAGEKGEKDLSAPDASDDDDTFATLLAESSQMGLRPRDLSHVKNIWLCTTGQALIADLSLPGVWGAVKKSDAVVQVVADERDRATLRAASTRQFNTL